MRDVFYFIVLCTSLSLAQSKNEQSIQGIFLLDHTIWEPVVYLSHIPSFDEMYTISKDMIIAETTLDAKGNFEFSTTYFPEEEQLYRIHFAKKEAPAASLIIGGPEENHFFIIASKNKGVSLRGYSKASPFQKVAVVHSLATVWLKQIDLMASYVDSTQYAGSNLKREFIASGVHEQLRNLADTLSQPLTSLYALHRSEYKRHAMEYPDFYMRYLEKWQNQKSPYFLNFKKEILLPKKSTPFLSYILLGILFFVLGAFLMKWYSGKDSTSKKLKVLSIQERKIFDLIKSGYSNKEISEAHNIGLSTVKSHVSNIYAKLQIKSRKEAMDY